MKKQLLIAASTLTLIMATPALAKSDDASCGNVSGTWMSKDAVKTKVAAQGYDVRRIKRENGCYEAYAISSKGNRLEIYINPVTGNIVKTKNKS